MIFNVNFVGCDFSSISFNRQEIIERLQNSHGLVILVSDSLKKYIDNVRKLVSQHPELDSATFCPDKRYCHELQVQERLNFLRFLLKVNSLNSVFACLLDCLLISQIFVF